MRRTERNLLKLHINNFFIFEIINEDNEADRLQMVVLGMDIYDALTKVMNRIDTDQGLEARKPLIELVTMFWNHYNETDKFEMAYSGWLVSCEPFGFENDGTFLI